MMVFFHEVRAIPPFFLILRMWQISDISSVILDRLTTSKPCFLNFGFDLIPSLKDYSNQFPSPPPRGKKPHKKHHDGLSNEYHMHENYIPYHFSMPLILHYFLSVTPFSVFPLWGSWGGRKIPILTPYERKTLTTIYPGIPILSLYYFLPLQHISNSWSTGIWLPLAVAILSVFLSWGGGG